MKGVSIISPGEIRMTDLPEPKLTPGGAIVKIKSAMICGSDISAFRGKGLPPKYPIVIGHEVAGEVAEIGPEGSGLKKGDRVILNPYIYCGQCYPCSLGRTNCCQSLMVLGCRNTDGAMTEYFSHPAHLLIKAPEAIPWELVPLAEPLTISLHALRRTALKAGEHVVIVGAGPIGFYAALAAKARGAVPILLDRIGPRLALARREGIEHTLHTDECDAAEAIAGLTEGRMAEVVIEASGANSQIQRTLDYASYCGRIAFTGWPSGDTPIFSPTITRKELDIRGSRTGVAEEIAEALAMIASAEVNVRACVTEMVAFDQLPQAVRKIAEQPEKYLKIGALLS